MTNTASLALKGYYQGLLDGRWGKSSQSAIEAFSHQRHEIEPINLTAVELVAELQNQIDEAGWQTLVDRTTNISFAFPRLQEEPAEWNNGITTRRNRAAGVAVSTSKEPVSNMKRTHFNLERLAADKNSSYIVRNKKRWVTSVKNAKKLIFYTRSDWNGKSWSSIRIIAPTHKRNVLNTIAASIDYNGGWPWSIPNKGRVQWYTDLFLELSTKEKAPHRAQIDEISVSSGTGFYINSSAHILTNQHVIDSCSIIQVSGVPYKILAASREDDLAVLMPTTKTTSFNYTHFSAKPAKLNSDITVAGFPLQNVLGGLNIVRGSITASKGLYGNRNSMQISAPVQHGNSGGPVFDVHGNVVGVVVSKLNALKQAELNGDIPQNVNFAIRAEVAKLFLANNDIDYFVTQGFEEISNSELARSAKNVTALVMCE